MMKNYKLLLIALLSVFILDANAQEDANPWAFGLGTNFVDFYPTGYKIPGASSNDTTFGSLGDEFFNTDNYNFGPIVSRLTVGRHLHKSIILEAGFTYNQITKVGKLPELDSSLDYFGFDLAAKWQFLMKKYKWYDPFISAGFGYTSLDSYGAGTFNVGLGSNFWFTEKLGAYLQTNLKTSFDEDNLLPHFQHSVGLIYRFGGKDADGDKIVDLKDRCPKVAGEKRYKGCVDTDGDGVPDPDDACPELVGPSKSSGCPDTDGDGVVDPKDACPEVPGPALSNGCPDTDEDGVYDRNDACPEEAGPAENSGCPWPDTDGDGLNDNDDECPEVAGPVSNMGCPDTPTTLDDYNEVITFPREIGSVQAEQEKVLTEIAEFLVKYPDAKFEIDGHADSVGTKKYNQKLSEERAQGVYDFLVAHGIAAENLQIKGYGETKPVSSNDTESGRADNRRVEINLIKLGEAAE